MPLSVSFPSICEVAPVLVAKIQGLCDIQLCETRITFASELYRSQVGLKLGLAKGKDNVLNMRSGLESNSWYPPSSFGWHNTRHTRAHTSRLAPSAVLIRCTVALTVCRRHWPRYEG